MQPFTAVVFDLFGTLVPAVPDDEYRQNHAEMARVLAIPETAFRQCWRDLSAARAQGIFPSTKATVAHVCATLGVAVSAAQIECASQLKLALTRRTLLPRGDALETLAAVQRLGLPISLISDCTPDVPRLWAETSFVPFIQTPVFSCQAGCQKPAPAIYTHCCDLLQVRPQDCLYIGDGASQELTGATGVGMHAVQLYVAAERGPGAYRPDAEAWHGPTISALSEALTLLA